MATITDLFDRAKLRGPWLKAPDRVLSGSAIETFCECPELYNLKYNVGLRWAGYKPALTIGSATHAGIERIIAGEDMAAARAAAARVFAEALAEVDTYQGPDEARAAREQARYHEALAGALIEAWRVCPHSADAPVITIEETEVMLGPEPILNPRTGWPSRTFCLAGRTDGHGRAARGNGGRYARILWELKTSSEDPQGLLPAMEIGVQIPIYQWLLSLKLGERIEAAVIDVIEKPRIRKLGVTKQRAEPESPEAYGVRCLEEYRSGKVGIHRLIVPASDSAIRTTLEHAWRVAEAIRAADRSGYLAPRGRRCRKSFGWCEMKPYCWHADRAGYRMTEIMHEELDLD